MVPCAGALVLVALGQVHVGHHRHLEAVAAEVVEETVACENAECIRCVNRATECGIRATNSML